MMTVKTFIEKHRVFDDDGQKPYKNMVFDDDGQKPYKHKRLSMMAIKNILKHRVSDDDGQKTL